MTPWTRPCLTCHERALSLTAACFWTCLFAFAALDIPVLLGRQGRRGRRACIILGVGLPLAFRTLARVSVARSQKHVQRSGLRCNRLTEIRLEENSSHLASLSLSIQGPASARSNQRLCARTSKIINGPNVDSKMPPAARYNLFDIIPWHSSPPRPCSYSTRLDMAPTYPYPPQDEEQNLIHASSCSSPPKLTELTIKVQPDSSLQGLVKTSRVPSPDSSPVDATNSQPGGTT